MNGKSELNKFAVKDQVVAEVIWARLVGQVLRESTVLCAQVTGDKELGAYISTVVQGKINVLLNAVWVRRYDKNGVLHTHDLQMMNH